MQGVAVADYVSTSLLCSTHGTLPPFEKIPHLMLANHIAHEEFGQHLVVFIILGDFSHSLVVLHAMFRM